MTNQESKEKNPVVLVIGAGPTGLYAARKLAKNGIDVLILNRDVKPGGLAEYGIYLSKHKMKEGLRKQFRKILALPNVKYIGGVQLGENAHLSIQDIENLKVDAVLIAIGAQGTKLLGLPGEEKAKGVFHAKDLVFHYNKLPPFASQEFSIGKRAAIIGMGNVMLDIAHWLICEKKIEEVICVGRRGPAERAYTDKEMRNIAQALDTEALEAELLRIKPSLDEVGQDAEALKQELLKPIAKAKEIDSPSKFSFQFLSSSKQVIMDEDGRVSGLQVERNKLVQKNDKLRPQGIGQLDVIPIDTLIYAIGDQVDSSVGLPNEWGKYKVPEEAHPQHEDRARYEVFDPETGVKKGWFLAGWARSASDGLVGKARIDAETAVEEVMSYIQQKQEISGVKLQALTDQIQKQLTEQEIPFVDCERVERLEAIEQEEAKKQNKEFFKFDTNEAMFSILDK